jgi:mannose-6-phosphate isomerase-like protein (cupin superfamily)
VKIATDVRVPYDEPEIEDSGMRLELLQVDSRFPFESSRFVVEPGGCSPPDVHSVAEMWIIIQGTGELLYDQESIPLNAGDAVYFQPLHTHQIKNHSSEPLRVISFWWQDKCLT